VARLDEARVGVPQVVVVEGEPGIGKSRIVAAAAARAAERGTAVLTGRAYRHLSLPYLPLLDALFPALDRLVAADPGLEPDADLLRRLQGTGRAGEPAHRGRVLSGLTRLVFELARRRPLLLVVEDVHHADAATATLLRHLAFRMSEASGSERVPLAVVLTSWPWQADPELLALRREECCTTLALAGLDRIDTAALLAQLGAGAMAASTMEAVWRRTGGNPLYVEAVARDPAARLPAEIGAVVGERFAALDDGDAGLLAVAALLGPDCRLGVLGRVVGLDPAVVAAAAGRAEGVGIVRCDDDRLAFASPLYEAAAHDRLPSPARRNWHRRIAVALAGEPGDHVLAIARHLLEAGPEADAELVRRFAGPAGDRARAAFAWPDAAAFYEAAVRAAGPDPPAAAARLYHEAGRARVAALDWDAGLRNLDAAIAAYERAGDARGVAAAHLDRVRLEIGRGRFGTLIDTAPLEAAVARVAARDPRLAAAAMVDVSQALWMRREAGAARRTAEKALARAEELADPATVARAANSLAAACWMTLDLRAAQAHLERARAAGVADGDPASLASSLHRLALGSVWLGDLARAEEVAAEAFRSPTG
jgi:predicted ATPase